MTNVIKADFVKSSKQPIKSGKDRYKGTANEDSWDEDFFREMEADIEQRMRGLVRELSQKYRWTLSREEMDRGADKLTDLLLGLNSDIFAED